MSSIWDGVIGQPAALARLRASLDHPVHAYLFVGPPGSTKDQAARAFAAALVSRGEDPTGRDARLALAGEHPDVREIERTGAAISAEQAREIVRLAALAPVEGDRKVMILREFHLLLPEGAGRLLKTIEEPPASTTFIVLADFVPPELVTIASRCVRVEFRPIADEVIADELRAGGADEAALALIVRAAAGDLTRARLLATDPALADRLGRFTAVPHELDGTGGTAFRLADELLGLIDQAAAPLQARQQVEVAELDARIERLGERGSGRTALEERHHRELRRHRTDELRAGLAAIASTYRDALVAAPDHRTEDHAEAVARVIAALEALERNPNEKLLVQALLWDLPGLG